MPGPFVADQPLGGFANQIKRCEKIHIEDLSQLLIVHLHDRAFETVPGVGKDDIEPTEGVLCSIKHALRHPLGRNVTDYDLSLSATLAHSVGDLLQTISTAGVEHRIHPGLGALDRSRSADTRTGAGDDDDLIGEIAGHEPDHSTSAHAPRIGS